MSLLPLHRHRAGKEEKEDREKNRVSRRREDIAAMAIHGCHHPPSCLFKIWVGRLALSAKVNRAKYRYGMCMLSLYIPERQAIRNDASPTCYLGRYVMAGINLYSSMLLNRLVTCLPLQARNFKVWSASPPHLCHFGRAAEIGRQARSSFRVLISPIAGWDDETKPVKYVYGLTEVHATKSEADH